MKPLRVAIVGCGKIADQHFQQIRRVPNSRIVATCDREILMAGQLAERAQADHSFSDVDQLLESARPDVVHVTTPPQSHFELARKCLEAGCHVYIEKPFSIDLAESREIVALAERRGLKVTPGHNVQFSPEMIRMRKRLRNGALGGAPVHVESVFSYDLGNPSYVKALLGDDKHWVRMLPGKLLQNVISHGIAKIAEFLPSTELKILVHGATSPRLRSMGESDIVDELRVIIASGGDTTAYFTFTTQVGPPVQELRVFGPRGALVVDYLHRTVVELNPANSSLKSYLNFFVPPFGMARQYTRNSWENVRAFLRADFHMDAGMKNLIEAFYRSIQTDGPPPIPYSEILLTTAIMDEIFDQLDQPGRISSADPAPVRPAMALSGGRE